MAIEETKPWLTTPLVESTVLSKAAGCRIFLKLDNLQPSGSFKQRGIAYYCAWQLKRSNQPDAVTFYASSGGNAGLACVHAAQALGRPAHVIVPVTTKPEMVAKVRAAGASSVTSYGASWREADAYMREVVMPAAAAAGAEPVYVPPFDHPVIWQGHSSIVDEVHNQMRNIGETAPDVIACSVGGGGLLGGILQGIQSRGQSWEHTTTVAVETRGADSMAQSLDAGELVTLPGITSIATSLGCARVSEGVYDLARQSVDNGRMRYGVLSDAEAAMGCWRLADDERIIIEPACGVTVALCYGGRLKRVLGRQVRPEDKVVIVVCGGSNVSVSMLEKWRQEYGDLDADVVQPVVSSVAVNEFIPATIAAGGDLDSDAVKPVSVNDFIPSAITAGGD